MPTLADEGSVIASENQCLPCSPARGDGPGVSSTCRPRQTLVRSPFLSMLLHSSPPSSLDLLAQCHLHFDGRFIFSTIKSFGL